MSIIPIADMAKLNTLSRQEIYRNKDVQIATMSIEVDGSIPNEVHPQNTQITTVVQGTATIYMNNNYTKFVTLCSGDCVVIPKGQYHIIANHGTKTLKIYSIYIPPEDD